LKALSRGPWPARELAPPVVAHLMTSAPARTMRRTTGRTSASELATLFGTSGSPGMQQQSSSGRPDGLTASPIPPIGETIDNDRTSRGPSISPSSIARLNPTSSPAASRIIV
jgi:hypothetical protein